MVILKNKINSKLFPRWFTIWFLISCVILFIGGIADELSGTEPIGGVNAWGASIGAIVLYLILLIIWKKRDTVKLLFLKLRFPLLLTSVLIGVFFAGLDELINWPFNPLSPGISILGDIILTVPVYFMAHLFWFYVLKKYKFTVREALVVGGISGAVMEFVFSGAFGMIIIGVLILPFFVILHGFHMVMPKILLFEKFEKFEQKDTKWKYVLGIILPFLGAVLGLVIALVIGTILNIG